MLGTSNNSVPKMAIDLYGECSCLFFFVFLNDCLGLGVMRWFVRIDESQQWMIMVDNY